MKLENFGKWTGIVNKIRKVSMDNKLPTYIVGGFVRDLVLGRTPKDLDVMVDAEEGGMKLAQLLYKEYKTIEPVLFPRFGTAKIIIDGEDVEFVAPRKEFYEEDNRKPKTEKGELWDDAMRRDFSVNALFLNLENNEILDLTGNGINDLNNKILRVTDEKNPDIIMINDPLRIMRLFRQASQLDFSIDKNTYDAVIRNASKITTISKERVQEELNKILLTEKPSIALELLKQSGVLKYISPELDKLGETEEENEKHTKNVWLHTLKVVDYTPKNLNLRLAALLHDIGKPDTMSKIYEVTCPKCSKQKEYTFYKVPNIGIVCDNCSNNMIFNSEKELKEAFPNYEIHFYYHENIGSEISRKILNELKYSSDIIKEVTTIIKYHTKGNSYKESPEGLEEEIFKLKKMISSIPSETDEQKEQRKILNEQLEQLRAKSGWTDSAVRSFHMETDPYTENLIELTKADNTTRYEDLRQKRIQNVERLRQRIKQLNEKMQISTIKSPLSGFELINLYPNKKEPINWITLTKNFLMNEVLEGRLNPNDKEKAVEILKNKNIDEITKANAIVNKVALSWRE